MHDEVMAFARDVKARFPEKFIGPTLEVGSRNINGSCRDLFTGKYIGIDLSVGPGVDWVRHVTDIHPVFSNMFLCVYSTETLEHDKHWDESLIRMYDLVEPGGLLFFTCASLSRGEHGTTQNAPDDSPATNDHYRNLSEEDVLSVLPESLFSVGHCSTARSNQDLYFYGIKTGQ